MKIYAKSALIKEELDCKMNIGCDGIELQLLSELIDGEMGRYKKAEDIKGFRELLNYPVKVVHTPLLNYFGMEDVNIEDMCGEHFPLLDQVFYIANAYGERQNIKVLVVVHTETSLSKLMLQKTLWNQLVNAVGSLLFKYPYTEIGIENVTPVCDVDKEDIHLCSGFYKDNLEIIKKLREELNTDRIGSVLDTCHAIITKKYLNVVLKIFEKKESDDYELQKFFELNKEYIKLIHLADAKGNGYGYGKHGVEFSEKNQYKLERIISYYNLYEYTCPVTLEIKEENYLICSGYRTSLKNLNKIINLLN